MGRTWRESLEWLHTWAGVVAASVLFAVFWMGTVCVFDREIDRWMQPATRLAAPPEKLSLDATAIPAAAALAAGRNSWGVNLPTERAPQIRFFYRPAAGEIVSRAIDPHTGQVLPDQGTLGATGFLLRFHFMLYLKWLGLGYWIVGLASVAMLALAVSGVLIHRRLIADFFLFRPAKRLQRASLDLHNLTGVLALPFHVAMALSGLIILMHIYFPAAHWGAYGPSDRAQAQYSQEAFGGWQRARAGMPGTLGSLDAIVAQAEREWAGSPPFFVRVWHAGDANAYVEVRRSHAKEVAQNLDLLIFDGATGALLYRFEPAPVMQAQRFIAGLHFIQFDHWLLRWLYFAAGLAGCVMIATGFLFWLESRRARHAKKGLAGVRVVEALTVGSVSGLVIATLAFMVANRLLPLDAQWAGQGRAALEVWVFYLAWLATFAHAAWRRAESPLSPAHRAWFEQCAAIAALALAAVALNGLTTGDHLAATLARGYWPVAGVDLMLLAGAALAAFVAWRLRRARGRRAPVQKAGHA
jgi:uncharacterized iron-regulated membrane protein